MRFYITIRSTIDRRFRLPFNTQDTTTFIFKTDNQQEAQCLSGILNSPVINNLVKLFQSRGDYGFRDTADL